VERARNAATQPGGVDGALVALAKQRFAPYIETLRTSGLKNLREGRALNLEEYRAGLVKALKIGQ